MTNFHGGVSPRVAAAEPQATHGDHGHVGKQPDGEAQALFSIEWRRHRQELTVAHQLGSGQNGADTELGRINQLMASVSPLDTPLLRQIKRFSYAITGVIAVLGILLFAYGRWVRHMPFTDISRPWSAPPRRSFRKACRR